MTLSPELLEAARGMSDAIDDRFRAAEERTRRIVREVLAEEFAKISRGTYDQ